MKRLLHIHSLFHETEEVIVRGNPNWRGKVLAIRHHVEKGSFVYTVRGLDDADRVETKEEKELERV